MRKNRDVKISNLAVAKLYKVEFFRKKKLRRYPKQNFFIQGKFSGDWTYRD